MPAEVKSPTATPGDHLIISGHRVGEAQQTGEILDVLGTGGRPHYRIRWEDGHESIFFPGSDTVVRPAGRTH